VGDGRQQQPAAIIWLDPAEVRGNAAAVRNRYGTALSPIWSSTTIAPVICG
jgi:hypothetical protein